MKRTLLVTVLLTLTLVSLIYYIPKSRNITEVTLNFEGDPVKDYSCILKEKVNIEEAKRIYDLLKNYNSPTVETGFITVKYLIKYEDGSCQQKVFRRVRPVTDIFNKIFSSLEVRKQWEDIFKLNKSEVKHIEFSSSQKASTIILDDELLLNNVINSITEFELHKSNEDDLFQLCEVKFYNNNNNVIGKSYVYREDKKTNILLNEIKILSKLKVNYNDIDSLSVIYEGKTYSISDKGMINTVLSTYSLGTTNNTIVNVHINLKQDTRTHMYGGYSVDKIPKELYEILKIS